MAHIDVEADDLRFEDPLLIEGFPGVGLVGKITGDHLIEEFEMTHYANVHCEGIPKAAVYGDGESGLRTPVRLYADEERDLFVLRSDVPVSPAAASNFADCVADWYDDVGATPIYVSGLPSEKDDEVPALHGFATGDGATLLDEAGIDYPDEQGLVSGPTGALLNHAVETDRTSVGFVVESDPRFPDPEAARVVIKDGVEPLADVDVPIDDLVDRTEEIRQAKERLAERMQGATEESTQAKPLRMYQ